MCCSRNPAISAIPMPSNLRVDNDACNWAPTALYMYAQSKFTLFRETDYSDLVSSTLPKDGFKPALHERAFLPFSERPKKKPAIDTDASFPVFSRPQLLGVDFVGESCSQTGLLSTCGAA